LGLGCWLWLGLLGLLLGGWGLLFWWLFGGLLRRLLLF